MVCTWSGGYICHKHILVVKYISQLKSSISAPVWLAPSHHHKRNSALAGGFYISEHFFFLYSTCVFSFVVMCTGFCKWGPWRSDWRRNQLSTPWMSFLRRPVFLRLYYSKRKHMLYAVIWRCSSPGTDIEYSQQQVEMVFFFLTKELPAGLLPASWHLILVFVVKGERIV